MSAKRSHKRKETRASEPDAAPYGRADWNHLRSVSEEEIERTSPAELASLPDDFWESAELVPPSTKTPISLRVDPDVLEWFRAMGPRYQSRMNAVLRSYMLAMTQRQRSARQPKRRR